MLLPCERISEYPGYNSFTDAIYGRARKVKVVDYERYNAARRYNPHLRKEDYTTAYTLRYKRLPRYEHLGQKEYAKLMLKKLEAVRFSVVSDYLLRSQAHRQIGNLRITVFSSSYTVR